LGSKKSARFRKLHLKNVICNETAVYFLGAKNMLLIWVEGFVVLYIDINVSDEPVYKNTVRHILKTQVFTNPAVTISHYFNTLLQKL